MADDSGPSVPEGSESNADTSVKSPKKRSAVHFFLRGLAITLPPLITIWILVWVAGVLNDVILDPASGAVRWCISWYADESRPDDQFEPRQPWMPALEFCGTKYVVSPKTKDTLGKYRNRERKAGKTDEQIRRVLIARLVQQVYVPFGVRAVPYKDFADVAKLKRPNELPTTARAVYMDLVATRYFKSLFHLSAVAVILAVVLLYFIGRLVTARLGGWLFQKFESGILARVPLVSHVYSSVKQVTDFFFTERTVDYHRVVAVEYPRRGIWSIGFVTSDSFLGMTVAAGEPLVSVLMPTSPMPMTGFTVNVPRGDLIDLNITIDQAFQYCLSCGVLVPAQQQVTTESLQHELAKRLTGGMSESIGTKTAQNSQKTAKSTATDRTDAGAKS